MVRSSSDGLVALPSTTSIRTRTSLMSQGSLSDELLGGEELDELHAAIAFVGDDLARGPRRARLVRLDLGPCGVEADRAGVEAEVGERPLDDFLLLGGH